MPPGISSVDCILAVFVSVLLRSASFFVQELPTAAPFGDGAPQIEAVSPVPEVSVVGLDEYVLFLGGAAAVLAETFGGLSLVFVQQDVMHLHADAQILLSDVLQKVIPFVFD